MGYLTWSTILQVIRSAARKRIAGLATEIAYNATLALFPTILTLLAALKWFEPLQTAARAFVRRFVDVVPVEAVQLIRNYVDTPSASSQELFSIGFLVTLWVSSNVVHVTIAALDRIQQTQDERCRPFWKTRLVAIALTIGSLSLFTVASALIFLSTFVIRSLAEQAGHLGTILLGVWWCLNWPIALGIVTLAFACLFKFGPSERIPGQPVLPGALLSACAWALLSLIFRNYVIPLGSYKQVYGAIATVIILMFWFYLSAFVMLLGQQLNVTVGTRIRRQQAAQTAIATPSGNADA